MSLLLFSLHYTYGFVFAAGDPTGLWVWLARHHPQRQFDLPTATTSVQGCNVPVGTWVPGYLDGVPGVAGYQGSGLASTAELLMSL